MKDIVICETGMGGFAVLSSDGRYPVGCVELQHLITPIQCIQRQLRRQACRCRHCSVTTPVTSHRSSRLLEVWLDKMPLM